jgi:hypothetical protein
MSHMPPPPAIHRAADAELQAALARHGLAGFSRLLGYVPPGEALPAEEVGALVRLIGDAEEAGRG